MTENGGPVAGDVRTYVQTMVSIEGFGLAPVRETYEEATAILVGGELIFHGANGERLLVADHHRIIAVLEQTIEERTVETTPPQSAPAIIAVTEDQLRRGIRQGRR